MNSVIVKEFTKLLDYYQSSNDKNNSFKIISTKKTIRLINSLDFEITSYQQLKGIPGIGVKTLDKINEICVKGKLSLPE